MIPPEDQLQVLYEGLRFLRTIFQQQQNKFNELDEEMKDLVGVVINDAGIVICSLITSKMKPVLAKEMNLALYDLLKNVGSIKIKVEKKCFVTSPRTNELSFIDNSKYDFHAKKSC